MSVFSERLNYILKLRKVTQAELSSLTNIPKSAISQYLSGKFSPKQNRVYLICKALDVSPAWITGYDGTAAKMPPVESSLTEDEQILLQKYRTDESFQGVVRALIKADSGYDVFRAAKSQDGKVAPSVEKVTRERIKRLSEASETDEDL